MAHEHGALPPEVAETIDLWVSDFLDRPAAAESREALGESAAEALRAFLAGACAGGRSPADLEEADVAHGLLDHAPEPAPPGDALPRAVADLLEDLEDQGRLAGGRRLGAHARALLPAWRERSRTGTTLTRPGSKVGRNDPCPCGSGLKYKKCCLARA
jgi:hypothetical protein